MALIDLMPEKNTYISAYYPDDNFAASPDKALFAGRYQHDGDAYRTLLQFDLREISEKGLKTGNIDIIFLQLFLAQNRIPSGAIRVRLCRLLEPWEDRYVTWNTQPRGDYGQEIIIPAGYTGLVIMEVTSLVKEWLSGSVPNYGLGVNGDEQNNRLLAFHSTAHPDPGTWPRLIMQMDN
mgnify:CR=1 FL=1